MLLQLLFTLPTLSAAIQQAAMSGLWSIINGPDQRAGSGNAGAGFGRYQ